MKFAIATLFLLLFFLVIVLIGYSRLPDIVSNHLSKKMQVAVEIDDIKLSLQKIVIDKLEIGNPAGSILPKAMTCELITTDAPLSQYLNRQIVIDAITLDNVYLDLEFASKNSKQGNWTTIMRNLEQSSSKKAENIAKNGKSVLIKNLYINNIQCDLVYLDQKGRPQRLKPIKQIVLTNVSTEEGIPSDQISAIIVREMLRNVFTLENLQNMIEDLILSPPKTPWDLLKPFKGIFSPGN